MEEIDAVVDKRPQKKAKKADPLIGRQIMGLGLKKKLAQGGMGSIYLAQGDPSGPFYAIKVLHPQFASNKELIERFRREIMAIAQLKHAHIVSVEGCGWEEELGIYQVMEFLQGIDMSQAIKKKQLFPKKRIIQLATQIGSALSFTHNANVIHRDLKPGNIFLCPCKENGEKVKILDFGLAKVMEKSNADVLTLEGSMLGTPRYMSPEQIMSQWDLVDQRTDLYAFGIILYELITGSHPIPDKNYHTVLHKHVNGDLFPLDHYRPDLKGHPLSVMIGRTIAKDSDLRPFSAEELMAKLLPALELLPDTEDHLVEDRETFNELDSEKSGLLDSLNKASQLFSKSPVQLDSLNKANNQHSNLSNMEFDLLGELESVNSQTSLPPEERQKREPSLHPAFVKQERSLVPNIENIPSFVRGSDSGHTDANLLALCPKQFSPALYKTKTKIGSSGQILTTNHTLSAPWKQALSFVPNFVEQIRESCQFTLWTHALLETALDVMGLVPQQEYTQATLYKLTDSSYTSMALPISISNTPSLALNVWDQFTSLLGIEEILMFDTGGVLLQHLHPHSKTSSFSPDYILPVLRVLDRLPLQLVGMDFSFARGQIMLWNFSWGHFLVTTNRPMNKQMLTSILSSSQEVLRAFADANSSSSLSHPHSLQISPMNAQSSMLSIHSDQKGAIPVQAQTIGIPSELWTTLQKEYTRHIGPISKLIFKKTLKKMGQTRKTLTCEQLNDFVKKIASKLDENKQEAFLTKATHICENGK